MNKVVTQYNTYSHYIYVKWYVLLCVAYVFLGMYLYSPTAHAAEVSVDTTMAATNANTEAGSPAAVWVNDQLGYTFYLGAEGDIEMASSTDGGATWSSGTTVDTINTVDAVSVAVWWDGWTAPGTTTQYIHIATTDTGTDNLYYTRYDITNNTFSTTVLASTTQAAVCTNGSSCYASIAKASDNTLYMTLASAADTFVVSCTTTCTTGTNWSERTGAYRTPGDDFPFLMPVNGNNNMMLVWWDISADIINYNIYSATSSSWFFSATTSIASTKDDNTTYDAQLIGMAHSTTTGITSLVLVDDANDYSTADHDINFFTFSSTTGWVARTDVVTTAPGGLTGAKISYDEVNRKWYVVYARRATIGTNTTTNVYYRTSSDNGVTWSDESGPISDTTDDINGLTTGITSYERVGAWWNYTTAPRDDDVYYVTVADVGTGNVGAALTFSGILYSDEGSTPISTSKTVKIAIGTSTPSIHSTTTTVSGAWTITVPAGQSIGTSTPVVVWVDGDVTTRATLFTKASGPVSMANLNLYQNRVIVTDNGTSTTIADMTFYDSDDDSDIQYNAVLGASPSLTILTGNELHIPATKTFDPKGNVTISGNGSSTSLTDGTLHLPSLSTYIQSGTTTIAGSFNASSTATFLSNAGTLVFTATTTGKSVNTTLVLGNVTFANTSSVSFASAATTTNLTINAGATVLATSTLTITGNYQNNGTYNHNNATTTVFNNLTNWTVRSAAQANSWQSVTYGNGLFVAVSSDGTNRVMTSPDGTTWTVRTAAEANQWKSVTFGNGRFVAVANSGTNRVMYSSDGITWATSTVDTNSWQSVTYGNGLFVAVSIDGTNRVMTSSNGSTWTARSAAVANQWYAVTYGNGVFVAVAQSGTSRVMTSTDGITWTARTAAEANTWTSITYGNGLFVAVAQSGTSRVMTSPDGITWTARTAAEANAWSSVVYGNGFFVAVANTGINRIMTSHDGVVWTLQRSTQQNTWNGIVYANRTFVAVSSDGTNRVMSVAYTTLKNMGDTTQYLQGTMVGTSAFNFVQLVGTSTKYVLATASTSNLTVSDGTVNALALSISGNYTNTGTLYTGGGKIWTMRTAAEANTWSAVAYGTSTFVAVAQSGTSRVMTSTDGITWTARTAAEANTWTSITYGNGLFVAVAQSGTNRVMTSSDGITWTARTAAQANSWQSVTYGNGLFVAVSSDGTNRVMTSLDAITWTARTAAEANTWTSITFGNGLFVAVAQSGTSRVMTSTDGITWTARTAAEANQWTSITYGNGLFVAVAQSGTYRAMTSSDGITWSLRTIPESNMWKSVVYGNNLFVAVSSDGTNRVTTSADGITWTMRLVSDANNWQSVVYGNSLFVAVANAGINRVMTSAVSTTTFTGTSTQILTGLMSGAGSFDTLVLTGTSSKIFAKNVDAGSVFITSGATIVAPEYLTIYGNYTNNGTSTNTGVGAQWTASVASEATTWASVTYGNGLFVAVSTGGTNRVMTSPDGITWTARTAAEANSWKSVTYGNGLFVAVANSGTNRIMTSPDGITWTARAATQANLWYSVTYGNGLFVAVAGSGTNRVMRSSDGITWATSTAAEANTWQSVTYGNGLFVAVSIDGTNRVMRSSDGITWATSTATQANLWYSVTYGNGLFVAVAGSGTNRVMRSSDGITWATSTAAEANTWQSVTYGNGLFVAVSSDGTNRVMTSSDDGITWTARTATEANQWYSIAYSNGLFIVVAQSGTNRVMTSSLYSTTTFAGTTQQTATGTMTGASAFSNVKISNTSQNGSALQSVIFGAPASTTRTFSMTPGTSAAFSTATSTFQNIYLVGSATQKIYLRSVTNNTPWGLIATGTQLVSYVNVKDSHACIGGSTIDATDKTSTDAGGNTCWNFGFANMLSGILYADEGSTPITTGTSIAVAVGTSTPSVHRVTSDGSGQWSVTLDTANTLVSGTPILVWVDNDATVHATHFTKAASTTAHVSALDLYQNRVIVDHATGTDAVSISDMSFYDQDDDSDIPYTASSTLRTLSVQAGNELHIAQGKSFIPQGSVTINANASSTSAVDGTMHLTHNAWYAQGATTTIGGSLVASSSANFMHNGGTLVLTASTTGKYIDMSQPLGSVLFANSASMAFATGATTTNMTIASGATVVAPTTTLTITGTYTNAGTFLHNNGTTTFTSTSTTWTPRTAAQANQWTSVTYGNGLFVAVAGSGTNRVMTSPDGVTWTARNAAEANLWNSVTYGNNLFVAVAGYGTNRVMTSPDGITWTARTAAEANSWRSVTYGNGLFVAVSWDGTHQVMTSPDGIVWTLRAVEVSEWMSVTYGNGLFVAVSWYGTNRVMTSPDGITWIARTAAQANSWRSVTYGNGLFIAVSNDGTNRVMTSPDGITWTAHATAEVNYWYSVTYGNGLFVAVSIDGTNRVMTARAQDILAEGDTDQYLRGTMTATSSWNSLVFSGTKNVFMSAPASTTHFTIATGTVYTNTLSVAGNYTNTGNQYTSTGKVWTSRTAAEANSWHSVTYGNGLFVAVSWSGTNRVMTSPDGITWTARTAAEANSWYSVTYGNGLFVAVANSGTNRVMTSPDGITWTARTAAEANYWQSVTYGNGLFVAVGCGSGGTWCGNATGGNRVMTSPDGITWTARAAAEANDWSAITYGNGLFVAIAHDGTHRAMTSPDGITWTARTVEQNYWTSIVYGNGLFVAISDWGNFMTSSDGITWTVRVPSVYADWTSVTYGNGLFVGVAYWANSIDSYIMTSSDGITWTYRTASESLVWWGITYGNNTFVAVGGGGTTNVMTSDASSITFNGTSTQTLSGTMTGAQGFDTLMFTGTSTKVFANNASTTNMVVGAGATVVAPANLSIAGDYTQNGTFTHASGTVTLSGVTNQTATGTMTGTSSFYNLTVLNTTATTTFATPLTVANNFTAPSAGSILVFAQSGTTTFTNATITGTATTTTKLRSNASGNQFGMDITGAYTLSYIDLKDGNACDGGPDISLSNSIDSGNNTCWAFVNNLILAGILYADEGSTPITSGKTLGIVVGTTTLSVYSTTTTASGAWSVVVATPSGGISTTTPILVWVDGDPTTRAAVFTKTPRSGTGVSNLDLYQNRVIVRHEPFANASTTIADLALYDNDDDSDIPFTATTTTPLLTVQAGNELHIWTGTTFTPQGAVTVHGMGTTTMPTDGSLHLGVQSTYVGGGTTTLGGSFTADTTSVFTPNTYNLLFNATSTGKNITAPITSLGTTTLGGTGTYTFTTAATTSVLTIAPSVTVVAPASALAVSGDFIQGGTYTQSGGTLRLLGDTTIATGTMTGTSALGNVLIESGTTTFMGNASTTQLTIGANTTVYTPTQLSVAGDFTQQGMFKNQVGTVWTARTAPEANPWHSVTYGNGLFVAVSYNGTNQVMTSPDGITWTARTAPEANAWYSVTYGNGLFVAVAFSGANQVMTSPDGVTWTAHAAAEANWWNSVTYGNGLFVAVADSGTNRVMTSPDGITWTARTAAEANSWQSVTYGNGLFVAVSYNGTNPVMTSPDGITWTAQAAVGGDSWNSVTYGNGLFVAVSDGGINQVMTSPDGITWTEPTVTDGAFWDSVTYGNGVFVVVAWDGSVMTSPDGTTWTAHTAAEANSWHSVTYGNGLFVAVSEDGTNRVMTSSSDTLFIGTGTQTIRGSMTGTNSFVNTSFTGGIKLFADDASVYGMQIGSGATMVAPAQLTIAGNYTNNGTSTQNRGDIWTEYSTAESNYWNSVTYGNGLFVAVAQSGTNRVMTSPDGITWTARSAAEANSWNSVTYGNGLFVAVSWDGTHQVMTSSDGITWTARTATEANQWFSITYSNGLFVAVSTGGTNRVMTSPDGVTWTARTAAEANSWKSVIYGNGLFVAIANSGTNRIMTSPDGITWTARSAAEANSWYSVTYGNGLFVAVSEDGTNRVMTSPDGITWTARTIDTSFHARSVSYGNGLFVITGLSNGWSSTNTFLTSQDGITWTVRTAPVSEEWNGGGAYNNGMFVAVGRNNVITSFLKSTTTFNGIQQQIATGTMTGTSAFDTFSITNRSQNGSTTQSVVFGAPASTTGTFSMASSTSIALSVATSTFQNIHLQGSATASSTEYVYLRSSASGTPSKLSVPGTQELVSYVNVKDSNACSGNQNIVVTNGVDAGGNSCWTFNPAAATLHSAANQSFVYQQATTSIQTITITDSAIHTITATNDIRIKIATSTINMRFDTTDTSVLLGGTAAGKVSTTVSYEGNGSVLVLNVTSDFSSGDTLTISGLSYSQFATITSPTNALNLYTEGATDSTIENTDSTTMTITGSITLSEHAGGQVYSGFSNTTDSAVPLYAFTLIPQYEQVSVTNLVFTLANINNISTTDLTALTLYRDMNVNKTYDAGDVAVGGTGALSITGRQGTITFSTPFTATTSMSYLLVADTHEIYKGEQLTLALSATGITTQGVTSLAPLTLSGSSVSITHYRVGQSYGGGYGEAGGAPAQGNGSTQGGGNTGGGSEVGIVNAGETIGNELDSMSPTNTGTLYNSWTSASSAYVSDGVYASSTQAGNLQTYSAFGFNIPSNSTITGIKVKIEASGSTAGGSISVRLSGDGGVSTSVLQTTDALGTSDVVYTLGGQTDTWGRTWTPSEFNAENFNLEVMANPSNGNTVQIDAIQVRVYSQVTGGSNGGGGGEVSIPSGRYYANVYSAISDAVRTFFTRIWNKIKE